MFLIDEAKQIVKPGEKFGRLTVLGRSFRTASASGSSHYQTVVCECDCGAVGLFMSGNLVRRNSTSCGCFHKEIASTSNRTHGVSKTSLHNVWNTMKARCGNPNNRSYSWYGGRGIRVCDEWRESFDAFRLWSLANGYRVGLTIDRIDNNGNYEPSNCRWSTTREQSANRSDNRLVTIFGETKTMTEWSLDERCVATRASFCQRIQVLGWTAERALITPTRKLTRRNAG